MLGRPLGEALGEALAVASGLRVAGRVGTGVTSGPVVVPQAVPVAASTRQRNASTQSWSTLAWASARSVTAMVFRTEVCRSLGRSVTSTFVGVSTWESWIGPRLCETPRKIATRPLSTPTKN